MEVASPPCLPCPPCTPHARLASTISGHWRTSFAMTCQGLLWGQAWRGYHPSLPQGCMEGCAGPRRAAQDGCAQPVPGGRCCASQSTPVTYSPARALYRPVNWPGCPLAPRLQQAQFMTLLTLSWHPYPTPCCPIHSGYICWRPKGVCLCLDLFF